MDTRQEGAGVSAAHNYETSVPTIHEAFRKLVRESPRRAYIGHIATFIISEDLAEEGLTDVLDFLYRDHEVRSDFYIVISKDERAGDILQLLPPIEDVTSININNAIENGEKSYAEVQGIRIDSLFEKIIADGIEPAILGISTIGDLNAGKTMQNTEQIKPEAYLQLGPMAMFRDNQLIDWLNEEESKAFNYLEDTFDYNVGSLPCPDDGTMAVESYRIARNVTVHLENEQPSIDLEVDIDATVSEINCSDLDVLEEKSYQIIEEANNQKVERMLDRVIQKTKENQSDILGLGREVYRQHPRYWENVKGEWPEIFTDMDVALP
ncbi:Ger(x)C family spore germination protein [Salicibibacter kimchii]|nr:Ger(x)C family spore germination protein [Salicibibacter kimchii]